MAIAFNAATDGGNNGGSTNSLSFSHTCSAGSDRLLVVGFVGDSGGGADDVSSVTYGGVAMTLLAKVAAAGVNRFTYCYYLLGPSTGANNVVITCASSHFILAGAADYTGVSQSGQPDASTTNISAAADTTLTTSLTTVADNCWAVLSEGGFATGLPGAGTGSTLRTGDGSFGTWGLFDSDAAITPAGSYSMTTTRSSAANKIAHVMGAFAPAATGGGTDATASPTGVSGTGSVGSVAVNFSSNIAVTGVSATGSVGSVTVSTGANVTASPTGVSATGSAGSVTVGISPDVSVTGVSATGSVGSLAFAISSSIVVTGVSATGGVGSVTVAGATSAIWSAVTPASGTWAATTPASGTWTAA